MIDNHLITKHSTQNSKNYFTLDLHGARKTLSLSGTPLLIETIRADGKTGSTHPCTPNFANKDNQFDLPQHGPARTALWKVVTETEDSITFVYSVEGGIYPSGLKITQTARITDRFELYTIHTYTGMEPAPLIFGEHCYWDTFLGINDLKINNIELKQLKDFQHTFNTTGIVVPLELVNTLEIPGKPTIQLEQENMPVAVVWRGMGDAKYVCIEPVTMNPQVDSEGTSYFGSVKSLIKPGETKTTYFSIMLK